MRKARQRRPDGEPPAITLRLFLGPGTSRGPKMLHRISTNLAVVFGALTVLAGSLRVSAQIAPLAPEPYASIKSEEIDYHGPGREASYDLAGPMIRIGLIVPLQGPQKADGEAIVAAAKLALEDDAARGPLPRGRHLALAVGDESGPSWGKTANALIHLVLDEQAIAVVTSASGSTAHLSEQVGNRLGVSVLTLASDKTTTQIDLPWIFRLAPSDTAQAKTIAKDLYRTRGFQRVLLVTESAHDGRLGEQEFLDAARELQAPQPARVSIDPLQPEAKAMLTAIRNQSPQAAVFWTSSNIAREMMRALRGAKIFLPVYLCQEAAQESVGLNLSPSDEGAGGSGLWSVARAETARAAYESFARRYQAATGGLPSPVAAEAYDAVRLIALSVRQAGPNRARVRDRIANVKDLAGVSGTISFDNEGNCLSGAQLVRLR
jgi:branched-chain amino acid transport system substrate-binding protein